MTSVSTAETTLIVRVKAIVHEAQGIHSYDLRPVGGASLPAFTAGAHIDLHLQNGLIRSYSLLGPEDQRHRYVIAVNKDASSRGGSQYIHDALHVGDSLTISLPRNNFPLTENASHSVFVAGGIGITPFLPMIQRLRALGRSWELFYGVRNRDCAGFLGELEAYAADRETSVHVNFDHESGHMLDVTAVVTAAPSGTHLYCCGPIPMLEAFEKAASRRPADTVHVEYFKAKEAPAVTGGILLVLARSGNTLTVPPGKTILQAVHEAGVGAPHSCLEGVCGACETRVLEGVPEHRDLVLSMQEHAANRVMMICCSGSQSDRLVLDI